MVLLSVSQGGVISSVYISEGISESDLSHQAPHLQEVIRPPDPEAPSGRGFGRNQIRKVIK